MISVGWSYKWFLWDGLINDFCRMGLTGWIFGCRLRRRRAKPAMLRWVFERVCEMLLKMLSEIERSILFIIMNLFQKFYGWTNEVEGGRKITEGFIFYFYRFLFLKENSLSKFRNIL
jgi:hypothetical protein